jgi:NADPH:quinone reductase
MSREMRAVLCRAYGPADALEVDTVPAPTAGPGEVVVAVHAAGVQFVDNRVIEGKSLLSTTKLGSHFSRPMNAGFPIIPGMEAAGIVEEVGEGVRSVKRGDRVLGTCLLGAFAEFARFHELEVCQMPDEMDMASAAGFYSGYFTAYYALVNRAGLQRGETVLVLGAGSGVGIAITEVAKATGARVVGAASSDEKLGLAEAHGADVVVKYPCGPLSLAEQKDLAAAFKKAVNGRGIEVIADLVGGDYAEPAMRALAVNGRYLSIGFSAGIPSIPMHVIFNKNGTLLGVEPVSDKRLPGEVPDLMRQLFTWYREKKLRPQVTETYPLESAGRALGRLASRQAAGRVVLMTGLTES